MSDYGFPEWYICFICDKEIESHEDAHWDADEHRRAHEACYQEVPRMTAPNYTDKDVVNGWTREDLKGYHTPLESMHIESMAKAALLLWDARDSARATAALQDAAASKVQIRMFAMEKCVKVLRWFANANEENHTTHCHYCSAPLSEGHADPCGVVDAKKALDKLEYSK